MGQIIWLASYPKSGNTWMRMLLNNYFAEKDEKQGLDSLDLITFGGSSKTSYRAVTALDVDKLDDDEIVKLTPMAHAFMAGQHPDMVFAKTHNILSAYKGIPLITPEVTKGAVYIIRNPLDVVLSVADHFGLEMDAAIDFLNSNNASTAANETMVRQYFCSWSENVVTWTTEHPFPISIVKYEDLHQSAGKILSETLEQLGFSVDPKKVSRAVLKSSFKSLKSMEKKQGFNERSRHSKAFFRVGKTDQWKSKLTDEQVSKIVKANYAQMKRFGYLPKGF
ncbi:sulfotransferase domain-containing protein [Sneathiella sp. P13V-1]|uniref:sulfotransferase domain-containing protein n=1 Tax=Sneathiella sp. P13V-1 TaxID=2697366 RepID=UPI00187B2895|nr:sulfotransferase domain-containing protein [Sneathiella sp. P13V-1]MBE7636094.1 sulfotransferase domain-containing protein [Sneathiella sp. P13V-1]